MYVPYTNSHFLTDLNQTLHTSPSWSGRDRMVCMDPQYFKFSYLFDVLFGSEYRFVRGRWLLAPESPATALYPMLV